MENKFWIAIGIIIILILAISCFVGIPIFNKFLEKQKSETAQEVLNSLADGLKENEYVIIMTDEGVIALTRDEEKEKEIKNKVS